MEQRPIKFRAWDTLRKEMIADFQDTLMWKNRKERNVELMQFTGLKDKNGKEIYEGDVLRDFIEGADEQSVVKVVWDEKYACFVWRHLISGEPWYPNAKLDCERVEVIGNIYENPELLKN